ncbi:Ribbon-helix-helix protein, copG family [[Clostridium] sordellii]|uniref:DUF6364 family protein n=1 Tax=Paraclostridium sordellii TaxID=1505 RepID=UPI000541D2AC|nr:DUF6364 family protein [Paeniclostridium sordellii]CEK34565.1 Ribbon-helix-helix protein, copG family [[Clostridium] sordellii] [Paeniclostridium sordellii]
MSKKSLNISIDEKLIKAIKHIAIDEGSSASELISEYIKAIKLNRNIIKVIRDIENKKF